MHYLCVTPDREIKTRMIMEALDVGFGKRKRKIVVGAPPPDEFPFVVWGQEWTALEIIPEAAKSGRPFWHIDNGFWNPARGTSRGYYRMTYRSMSPVYLPEGTKFRVPTIRLEPWKKEGRHVLLAMPGVHFGAALGIDVRGWCEEAPAKIKSICAQIGRPFRLRERDARRNLRDDLFGAHCVVTHSSNVAVDAAVAGIPVFVAPTNPAAPVGRTDLKLSEPLTPGRDRWIRSLASQQFTIDEMRSGVAAFWMDQIAEIADGNNEVRVLHFGSSRREA